MRHICINHMIGSQHSLNKGIERLYFKPNVLYIDIKFVPWLLDCRKYYFCFKLGYSLILKRKEFVEFMWPILA
ncbi:hypothetical protein L6452_25147 [Arctium lappa]|uniref:Uncharacterized protein n=1 Tax=Arctium lappa TaxID=4217 RepID=A0ACB9AAI0_ARCLA|nr:hypothetical protein L6452_25147 [Arctium lappa]